MKLHLPRLRDEVVDHLSIDDPVDWIKQEHFARNESAAYFLNEQAIPRHTSTLSAGGFLEVLWLGGVEALVL